MEELLVWVDENDEVIGYGEKMYTHQKGQLHRAFSVFIYDLKNEKMLLQKRAKEKYHSGGRWSNACCSHPHKDELWCPTISACLKKELGITAEFSGIDTIQFLECPPVMEEQYIHFAGKFKYYSQYENNSEHEIDYVFVYHHDFSGENIPFNKEEAEEIKWISLPELETWLKEHPEDFTSWFADAYELFKYQMKYEKSWEGMEQYGTLLF